MKHHIKVVIILLSMFFIAQLIGLYVTHQYTPDIVSEINETTGEQINRTVYNLPYGFDPPAEVSPQSSVISIMVALCIAVLLVLLLMKLRAEVFLRVWFFVVIIIGIAIALNSFMLSLPYASLIAIVVATPLAFFKVFRRNLVIHNITEILIYPGIASIFIPLLNIWSAVLLLVLISLYDMYAVWHAGFMQKMAQYQIEKVRIFSGFFIPYASKKDRAKLLKMQKANSKSKKKVNVHVAILGGGDVVFPIILAGVVLRSLGLIPALLISLGATIPLALLFYYGQKGKAYPAMPFISVGCFIALGIGYLL